VLVLIVALGCGESSNDMSKGRAATAELGAPVSFEDGMTALCEAVTADTPKEQFNGLINVALHEHWNAEVASFWAALGDVRPADRIVKLQDMVDRAGLTACALVEWSRRR